MSIANDDLLYSGDEVCFTLPNEHRERTASKDAVLECIKKSPTKVLEAGLSVGRPAGRQKTVLRFGDRSLKN